MNQEQEIRARALEIAVKIYGVTEIGLEAEKAPEALMEYLPLASLIERYIQKGQKS